MAYVVHKKDMRSQGKFGKGNMEYAEVKVVLDEKKIAKVGKYPVDYIAHHVQCIAKIREMALIEDATDTEKGKHTLIYRTDYATNPNAPYTAGFFAAKVYKSPAKSYLDELIWTDTKEGSTEDCLVSFQKMDEKYGSTQKCK